MWRCTADREVKVTVLDGESNIILASRSTAMDVPFNSIELEVLR